MRLQRTLKRFTKSSAHSPISTYTFLLFKHCKKNVYLANLRVKAENPLMPVKINTRRLNTDCSIKDKF